MTREMLIDQIGDLFQTGWELNQQIKSDRQYGFDTLDICEQVRALNQISMEIETLENELNLI